MVNTDNKQQPSADHVGWDWERDLESQGHAECWHAAHLDEGIDNGDALPDDERLRLQVRELIDTHPLLDASRLEVEVESGVIILSGHIATHREIVVCCELVESVDGAAGLEILLSVSASGSR